MTPLQRQQIRAQLLEEGKPETVRAAIDRQLTSARFAEMPTGACELVPSGFGMFSLLINGEWKGNLHAS